MENRYNPYPQSRLFLFCSLDLGQGNAQIYMVLLHKNQKADAIGFKKIFLVFPVGLDEELTPTISGFWI